MISEDDIVDVRYKELTGQRFRGRFNQTVIRCDIHCDFAGILLSRGFGLTEAEALKDSLKG